MVDAQQQVASRRRARPPHAGRRRRGRTTAPSGRSWPPQPGQAAAAAAAAPICQQPATSQQPATRRRRRRPAAARNRRAEQLDAPQPAPPHYFPQPAAEPAAGLRATPAGSAAAAPQPLQPLRGAAGRTMPYRRRLAAACRAGAAAVGPAPQPRCARRADQPRGYDLGNYMPAADPRAIPAAEQRAPPSATPHAARSSRSTGQSRIRRRRSLAAQQISGRGQHGYASSTARPTPTYDEMLAERGGEPRRGRRG